MSSSRRTTESLLETIRAENPAFWPHGLSLNNFDTGRGEGVFLVRAKQANLAPVGFVGWQERREGGQRVGYYSIGILPEHRGQGYAKEAVAKLINIKSARVDKVVALIEKGNSPSQALARSLGVTVKQAGVKALLRSIGKGMTGPAAQTIGAGALGAGSGMLEAGAMENSGHVAQTGLPLTNAILAMVLANPRMRKDFFGASKWKDLNTKSLANFVGGKALLNAGILGADQTVGLMGKAQEAADGLGDAGKALTNVSRAVEDSTKSVTSEINRAAPQVAKDITGISGNLNRVTEAAGDEGGLPSLFKGLGEAGKHLPEVTGNAAKTTGNLDALIGSANSTSSSLRDMADAVRAFSQMKPSFTPQTQDTMRQIAGTGGGAALGGMLGNLGSRFFLDEVPVENTKKFNRNRRLRTLATLLGTGAGAYAGHKLS